MNQTINLNHVQPTYYQGAQAIKKVKTIGFTALTLTALLMVLFMVFSITYPLSDTGLAQQLNGQDQTVLGEFGGKEILTLSQQKATYETIFTGKARRMGDRLVIVARV